MMKPEECGGSPTRRAGRLHINEEHHYFTDSSRRTLLPNDLAAQRVSTFSFSFVTGVYIMSKTCLVVSALLVLGVNADFFR